MTDERLHILEMIDRGTITAEQGVQLIRALDESDALPAVASASGTAEAAPVDALPAEQTAPAPEAAAAPEIAVPPQAPAETVFAPEPEDAPEYAASPEPSRMPDPPRMAHYRNFWLIPLTIGAVATILSAVLMFLAYQASGIGFWFACTWFPFLAGVFVLALAWGSKVSPWLHVRVRQKPGERPQNISISFPLPVGLISWVLPFFKGKIPNLNGVNTDPAEMVGLLKNVSSDKPLYVEVDEPGGEHVEVYIG